MAKSQKLTVQTRERGSKRVNRRLRLSGLIPAVLYGHKQSVKNLSLSAHEFGAVLRHGNRFVTLTGEVAESAFIKDVQWNTWGTEVLHVDFARVDADEKILVTVPIELRGESPGTKDGGVVKQSLHSIELECKAAAVPEKLFVNINRLEFEQIYHVSDLELPEGAKVVTDTATVVVSCLLPVEVFDDQDAAADEAEPEIIGRKKTDEE